VVDALQTKPLGKRRSLLSKALTTLHTKSPVQCRRKPETPAAAPQQPASPCVAPQPPAATGIKPAARAETASGRDRRAFPRRDSGCAVSVCRRKDGSPVNAQRMGWLLHSSRLKGMLVDISMNGVAFTLGEEIGDGEAILLRLTNTRFGTHVDKSATVIRALPVNGRQWKIICQFDHKLTYEQVHDFGKNLFQSHLV
jgi:hypothetical protein